MMHFDENLKWEFFFFNEINESRGNYYIALGKAPQRLQNEELRCENQVWHSVCM